MHKQPAIYIMANKPYGTLYVGVTSNLIARVFRHKHSVKKCFTSRYQCYLLVYYELHSTMYDAITREKQLKGGNRQNKIDLIKRFNPKWNDLYDAICQ